MPPKELNFITGNKNKLSEVKAILGDIITVRSQFLDLLEIQGTIEVISSDKCRRAAEQVSTDLHPRFRRMLKDLAGGRSGAGGRYMSLLQRTARASRSLHVCNDPCRWYKKRLSSDQTNVNRSKWFLDKLGHEGLNNLLMAYDDKSAQAVCTFAYSPGPGNEPIIFQGRTTVRCRPPHGRHWF